MDLLTHALTIHQPWAWAIAAGHKPVENRTWRPPLEAVGKLIGIHAGLATDEDARAQFILGTYGLDVCRDLPVDPLPVGALIGVARLVGVLHLAASKREDGGARYWKHTGRSSAVGEYVSDDLSRRIEPWWRGPWGWLWSNEPGDEPLLLPEPIPMRGQQGLWRIPDSLRIDAAGKSYDSGPAAWALEQWRKAREARP